MMSRRSPVTESQMSFDRSESLATVKEKLGIVPKLSGILAHSPAALDAYPQMNEILGDGALDAPANDVNPVAGTEIDVPVVALEAA